MKKYLGWIAVASIAVVAFGQGSGKSLLESFVKSVNGSEAMSVVYTAQTVGQSSREYTLDLAKPNKARIESSSTLIVADGSTIVTYDKSAKTYFKQPQTQEDLLGIFADQDISLWSVFFNAKALDKVGAVKQLPNRSIAGVDHKVLEVAMDQTGKVVRTLFLDSKNVVRRSQLVLKDPSGEVNTVYVTRSSSNDATSIKPDRFNFDAPEGSREVSQEEMNAATWYTDLEEAKKVAAKTKRKIFVDFYADW